MTKSKVYLVTPMERAGHWINAIGIILLALSGFNIHFAREFDIFGSLGAAIAIHNVVGVIVSIGWVGWLIYMIATRRIRYYLPNREDLIPGMIKQARFYLVGIFRGEPHAFEESKERKFNPLQKWAYLGVMGGMLPAQAITGLALLYFIENWTQFSSGLVGILGILHTILGIFLTAFLIAHIYLATTGETPVQHLKMMFTGWSEHKTEE